jgi:hypothetical protein
VLGLPKDTPNNEVAARAEVLLGTARSDTERDLYAWARAELITNPETRARYEDLEPWDTDYERERRWEDFVRKHRRIRPASRARAGADAQTPLLGPETFDLDAAVGILIRWLADAEMDDPAPLFRTMPATAADGVPRLEMRDVLFG